MPQVLPSHFAWKGITKKEKTAIEKAYVFIYSYLHTLKRRSGESYAQHGNEVATTLSEVLKDSTLIVLALLHDIFLHPQGKELIEKAPLSPSEKNVLQDLHNLRRLHIDSDSKDLDKTIYAFTKDIRLLFIRMAHRLSDIRNLKRFPYELKKQLTQETLHMYCPLAGRLGLYRWRTEMEDLCFLHLLPRYAKKIKKLFERAEETDLLCLNHTQTFLEKQLKGANIPHSIEYRIKGLYSTYQKMLTKNRDFYEITDRLALRIIVQNIEDCYRTLGIVHTNMHPIPGEIKDYIGNPKENGYRSIHTVIYPLPGVNELPIEIQIRTQDMHKEGEFGFAAHYAYKDKSNPPDLRYSKTLRANLLRNLEIIRAENQSAEQFSKALRQYSKKDKILIFDAKNNFYYIKSPATALDFFCLTEKEHAAFIDKILINGREQPFQTKLRDGDTLEALLHPRKQVQPEWASFCLHRSSKKILKTFL